MDRHALWKWLVLAGLVAWSVALVTPIADVKDADGKVIKRGKLVLGLDLRGGTSYTLQVDQSKLDENAKQGAKDRALEVIRNRIDALGIAEPVIYPEPGTDRIICQIPGLAADQRARTKELIQSAAFLEFRMVHERSDALTKDLFDNGEAPAGYSIVSAPSNPNTDFRGGLYFKRDESKDPKDVPQFSARDAARKFKAPPGYELLLRKVVDAGVTYFEPYYVQESRKVDLTGENLTFASVEYDHLNMPYVKIKFDRSGKTKFENITTDYAPGGKKNRSPDGRRFMAIVLDGTLYSAPWIKQPIYGGDAIIEGGFSIKEATDLTIALRAGSLPAPVKVMEERTVDPTLGLSAVKSGKFAALIGAVLVVVFMLVYYLFAGVIANVALLLDLLLLPFGMMLVGGIFSMFGGGGGMAAGSVGLPTLTLPGIAGIILTLGMAVDANVLIFERIREEQASGKRLEGAVSAGYDRAFTTIFDSNLTTLFAAVIMFWQGSGAIRGYAITLSAGIVVSMYTAVMVTRMIFNSIVARGKIQQIKMLQLVKKTNFDFLGKRKMAMAISLILLVGSWSVFLMKGKSNYNVDFIGGTAVKLEFKEKVSNDAIREALAKAGLGDVTPQYQRAQGSVGEEAPELLEIKAPFEVKVGDQMVKGGALVGKVMEEQFAAQGYHVVQEDSVGPQIGDELKKKGLMALAWSFLGMVLYISWRFEFAFAVGAIVALLHDALIAVGVFCLLGRQLSTPMIAAVLTIVGYSVNDTIVIFDRIREDLKLFKGRKYSDIANMSINQTLSRTLLTSGTTLLSVLALLLFGGGAINDFALLLFIGIVVGTYSSVFIATPIVLFWHRDDKKEPVKGAVGAKA